MGRARRRRDQRGQSLVSFALAMVPFFLLLLYMLYAGAYALRWSVRSRLAAEAAFRTSAYPGVTSAEIVSAIDPARRALEARVDEVQDTGGRFYGVPIRWRVSLQLLFRKWRFWDGPPEDWW
jgi:Flp pilus assembly protein TadG